MTTRRLFGCLPLLGLVSALIGCAVPSGKRGGERATTAFTIASGSENRSLEPTIQRFAERTGRTVTMTYEGSLEIAAALGAGRECPFDAVWPASSIAITLGDSLHVVKHARSIFMSPVVLGVKLSVARKLGWMGKDVQVADILKAAESGGLRFGMTSASQSNSGAMAYLSFLNAFAGSPDVLTLDMLRQEDVSRKIRRILGAVHRSSGSSGFLMDLLLSRYEMFDAVMNYESLIIETNQKLVAQGKEPLYVIYPVDGISIADSPLGYVDRGHADNEKFFLELQEYLLSDAVQQEVSRAGRRVSALASGATPDPAVFNAEWGIDVKRILSPVRLPPEPVIREALNLYQVAFRKPSLTIYALDYSGSMEGDGERQLKEAMRMLLDPDVASRYLLQASARDLSIVIAFSDQPEVLGSVQGNDPQKLRELLWAIERRSPGGGTGIYRAVAKAFAELNDYAAKVEDYHVAVILMSDGNNTAGTRAGLTEALEQFPLARGTPVYTILFGEASREEMSWIAEQTSGRMFDGTKDLVKAMKEAKGYN